MFKQSQKPKAKTKKYKLKSKSFNFLVVVLAFLFFVLSFQNVFAQDEQNLEKICEEICETEEKPENLSKEEYEVLLKKCEIYYQEESQKIEKDLNKTTEEKKTWQNKIYWLKNTIKNLDYQIYQSNLVIKDIGFQITDTKTGIEKTSSKVENSQEQIANILRTIYEKDQKSLIEILLSEKEISGFYNNLFALETLNSKSQQLLDETKNLKTVLENQKQSLGEEKQELENSVIIKNLQKQESAKTKKDQEYFLKLTETEYQNYLQEKEKIEEKAASIRARIFELIGVPEAPTFGEAYEIAKYVESIAGVRPALLLAVLTQESNIGKNVGQCYLKNPSTGEGVVAYNGQKVSKVMKPMNLSGRKGDVDDFLKITEELGRDPKNTPVSCPMSIGWGGAMGPAQFIPTTWMIHKDRIEKITGKTADPWNIKDAFLAAGLHLKDVGAIQNEFKAVMRYFSGYRWSKWEEFYGRSVLAIADQYEKDIKEIAGL